MPLSSLTILKNNQSKDLNLHKGSTKIRRKKDNIIEQFRVISKWMIRNLKQDVMKLKQVYL